MDKVWAKCPEHIGALAKTRTCVDVSLSDTFYSDMSRSVIINGNMSLSLPSFF